MELVLNVEDLTGRLEKSRGFSGSRHVSLRLGESTIDAPMEVTGVVTGTVDGVQAGFEAAAVAMLACVRCLTRWEEPIRVGGTQHFTTVPDEDGYAIVAGRVDVGGPATDEISLALPLAPLCSPECRGLCPICGTDLNSDPCDGHGEESDSPFAALKDLFDS